MKHCKTSSLTQLQLREVDLLAMSFVLKSSSLEIADPSSLKEVNFHPNHLMSFLPLRKSTPKCHVTVRLAVSPEPSMPALWTLSVDQAYQPLLST